VSDSPEQRREVNRRLEAAMKELASGTDERFSTRSFYEGLEFLYRLMRVLSSVDVM